jgi:transcriptional regulator GlxA family with amidase domain
MWHEERIVALARKMYIQDIDVRAVASAVGIPYETFRKRFQQHISRSPREFRRLLAHTADGAE